MNSNKLYYFLSYFIMNRIYKSKNSASTIQFCLFSQVSTHSIRIFYPTFQSISILLQRFLSHSSLFVYLIIYFSPIPLFSNSILFYSILLLFYHICSFFYSPSFVYFTLSKLYTFLSPFMTFWSHFHCALPILPFLFILFIFQILSFSTTFYEFLILLPYFSSPIPLSFCISHILLILSSFMTLILLLCSSTSVVPFSCSHFQ